MKQIRQESAVHPARKEDSNTRIAFVGRRDCGDTPADRFIQRREKRFTRTLAGCGLVLGLNRAVVFCPRTCQRLSESDSSIELISQYWENRALLPHRGARTPAV